MGAWGPGSFENDWALDWAGDLCEADDDSLIASTLAKVVSHGGTKRSPASLLDRLRGKRVRVDYLEAGLSSHALAAAEVIAARLGKPAERLPDSLGEWLEEHPGGVDEQLRTAALRA